MKGTDPTQTKSARQDAYDRLADIVRMYVGPIIEEATAFGHLTKTQQQTIADTCAEGLGVRVVLEVVDQSKENTPIQ